MKMAIEDSPLFWAVGSVIVAFVLYHRMLDFSRDVPPEYLELQSVVDSTRLPNELAIYKSTKLDYSSGLRVGLGIRYDHYKLRNGNLSDVWEIMLRCLKTDADRAIWVGDKKVPIAELNFQVHEIAKYLTAISAGELHIPTLKFIVNGLVLAVSIACFVSRTTLHLYDEKIHTPKGLRIEVTEDDLQFCVGPEITLLSAVVGQPQCKTDFENVYTPEKDKGIALRVTTKVNVRVVATTDFTQTNLVSAVASCIKNLPSNLELSSEDRLVVVQNTSCAENITNSLVKVLAAFITHTELVLTWEHEYFMALKPTVLSCTVECAKGITVAPTGFEKLFYFHRLYALSRLKFSLLTTSKPYPKLRLVFAHRSLKEGSYTNWNEFRASLSTQVVEELGYYNVAGPVVTSDVLDYRKLPKQVEDHITARGSVVQANEFKLVNYNGVEPGDLCIRGYNIGKATTTMANVGEKNVRPDSEGFYTFPVEARWGTDGCLYVMKS